MKNLTDIEKEIMKFNKDIEFQELRNRYNTPTFLDALGVGRSETAHSAMLKWLLQGNEIITDEKNTPLVRFLDILVRRNSEQGNDHIDPDLRTAILGRSISFQNITVVNEKPVSECGKNITTQDRIDIYIEATLSSDINCDGDRSIKKIVIVIENKIKSNEGGKKSDKTGEDGDYNKLNQTERYYYGVMPGDDRKPNESCVNISDDTHYLFVYLTPLPNAQLDDFEGLDSDKKATSSQYIQINYQDIADEIIYPILKANNQTVRVKTFLDEYMNSLTIPGILEESEEDKKQKTKKIKNLLIMATSDHDKELLGKFYTSYNDLIKKAFGLENPDKKDKKVLEVFKEQNKAIIFAALTILSLDSKQEDLGQIVSMLNTMNNSKSTSYYKYNGENFGGHINIVRHIVGLHAKKNTQSDVCRDFNKNNLKIVYTADEIENMDKKRYAKPAFKCMDNKEIYCNNQWTSDNMPQVIDIFKENYYDIKTL